MRKIITGLVLAMGLIGAVSNGASAAPTITGMSHRSDIVHADYYYQHRHWEHRHYEHHHWHYY